jgi:ribosomal protein S18 acetylase RimI-like enzyme
MTLHPATGAPTIDLLGPPDLVETFGLLDREPVLNVYLIALTLRDALARPRDEVWGARRDGRLVALVHLGGTTGAILPVGEDDEALDRLARHAAARRTALPRRTQLIGPRAAVRAFARELAAAGAHARLARDQVYLALERHDLTPFERLPELRAARPEDREVVAASGIALRVEELGEDPRAADAAAYERRVEDECREGHTWLWLAADGLRFRASVSALTPDAAQISGVFTPAIQRRRGNARRALSELCARVLTRARHACLFVNDFNEPALGLYRALGFRPVAEWGSVFYDALS